MYPALNMNADTLRVGLHIMEEAIQSVSSGADIEGDSAAYPTGVAGF